MRNYNLSVSYVTLTERFFIFMTVYEEERNEGSEACGANDIKGLGAIMKSLTTKKCTMALRG